MNSRHRIDAVRIVLVALAVIFLGRLSLSAQTVQDSLKELSGVKVVEHLGDHIPMDLHFTDDQGKAVTIGDYFHKGKPVLLDLAYYECPMLCNLVMNGVSDGIKGLNLKPGKDYEIVTVSINPKDSVFLAAAKKETYIKALNMPGAENGWHFLVGPADQSKALAEAVGFEYKYLPDKDQYAHPACIFLLGPDGKISRYLYGITYKQNDLKLGLIEASEGKIGNTLDKVILFCYHYDPDAKGYALVAGNVMKVGGLITFVLLALFLAFFWIKERRSHHHGHRVTVYHGRQN
ncbi:MAG TPA: SCO family protein [candidate division Zixibacteria bacterium]|nr:SCO family protein [candidate division Zixibacteria bacterium]